MITYIDTSTLLKILIEEPGSDRATVVWSTAAEVASVALIVVEARAALATATRLGRLTSAQHALAKAELSTLLGNLHLVSVDDEVLVDAAEVAESESLRGYDAVHLAAAMLIGATVFSSADRELCAAAQRQGMYVANPLSD